MARHKAKKRRARAPRIDPFMEPEAAARSASLRYVTDDQPGIRRRRRGGGFEYQGADGRRVTDAATMARVRALAIPPAWTNVWISSIPHGHLQATGRDTRGRKQYRYHRRWRAVRDETKYERLLSFGSALPAIRERVRQDLAVPGLPRRRVLATIVRLLETTLIRVGNEEYARHNGSYGLTTLRNRHVRVRHAGLDFQFPGKSGKSHTIRLNDRQLARVVSRCRDLPGQELFQYLDDEGEPQPINSSDVNDYLREISGDDFTAKDFRTWAGTLIAAEGLAKLTVKNGNARVRSAVVRAAEIVAGRLGNTPSISRKCYIHPTVLSAYGDPMLRDLWVASLKSEAPADGLTANEIALLQFLEASPRAAAA